MEWFGWEGHLKTVQFHPLLWAGVLQLCWCLLCQGTAWAMGYLACWGGGLM